MSERITSCSVDIGVILFTNYLLNRVIQQRQKLFLENCEFKQLNIFLTGKETYQGSVKYNSENDLIVYAMSSRQ